MITVEYVKGKRGWTFRIKAKNGRILCSSTSQGRVQDCLCL